MSGGCQMQAELPQKPWSFWDLDFPPQGFFLVQAPKPKIMEAKAKGRRLWCIRLLF